ncbi:MAG: protein kinase [Bacteroidales bacterium]
MLFDNRTKRIYLSKDDEGKIIDNENIVIIDNKSFYLKNLKPNEEVFGGNSSLFILYDKEGEQEERVLKFSNYAKPIRKSTQNAKRRYGRFITEIEALKKIKNYNIHSNIVSIFDDGHCNIDGRDFPFYTMEKADDNLKMFLLSNGVNVDFLERVKLIRDIFNGINTLHELDFYHRDIKPDNVLLFFLNDADDDEGRKFAWKIGDLGLLAHRENDYDFVGSPFLVQIKSRQFFSF